MASVDEVDPYEDGETKSDREFTSSELYIESPQGVYKHPYKYKCPFCSKIYTTRVALIGHKNAVHLRAKPYRCDRCNEHFASSAVRGAHIHKCIGGAKKKKDQPEPPGHSLILATASSQAATSSIHKPEARSSETQTKSILPEKSSASFIDLLPYHNGVPPHAHAFPPSMPWSAESHECSKCSIHFEFVEDLLCHLSNHPFLIPADGDSDDDLKVPSKLNCIMCSFVPDKFKSLQEHIVSVHFKANLPANKSTVNNNESPGKVLRSKHCQHCFREFDNSNQMEIHMRYHHKTVKSSESDVPASKHFCKICSLVFSTFDKLENHQKFGCKASAMTQVCKICDARFRPGTKPRRHTMKAQSFSPKAVSMTTDTSNISKGISILQPKPQMNATEKNSVPTKIFVCLACREFFNTETHLGHHKTKCVKANNSCPVCKEGFFSSAELLKHMSTAHTSAIRMVSCNKCNFSTDSVRIFAEHYKKHMHTI